jgi:NADH-quinone oxidoreductase subunit L
VLVAIAVVTGVAGIAYAARQFRTPMPDKAHALPDTGLAGVLSNAYGVDAGLDAAVVRPVNALADGLLARGVDVGIDGSFNAGGRFFARTASLIGQRLQDGDVGKYAWLVTAGALAMLAAFTLR